MGVSGRCGAALGMKAALVASMSLSDQRVVAIALIIVIAYLLAAFLIYAVADLVHRNVGTAEALLRNTYVPADVGLWKTLVSFLRDAFDILLPPPVGGYAIYALIEFARTLPGS